MDELFFKSLHYIESTLDYYVISNLEHKNDNVINELQDIVKFMNLRFGEYLDALEEHRTC